MGFLKSYFAPGKSKDEGEKGHSKKPSEAVSETSLKRLGDAGRTAPAATPNFSIPGAATPIGSRPPSSYRASLYPSGDFRNARESLLDVKADVMCSWLYQQQLERQYATGVLPGEGVVLKKGRNDYACCPPQLQDMKYSLYDMAMELNVRCAMTVNTRVINVILASRRSTYEYIPLPDGLRLQVLPSMRELPRCQKHHFAAFIQDLQIMVVWDDEPKKVLARADALERQLMRMIWGSGDDEEEEAEGEKGQGGEVDVTPVDLESGTDAPDRRIKLTSAFTVALTLALSFATIGIGYRSLAFEIATDASYVRLALIAVSPLQLWVGYFFFQSIIINLFEIFGPITAVFRNNKNYSGAPPKRLDREYHTLPHVTIQMPVYKEGLKAVIMPTVQSLKQCMSTYELQGGTANIFVNDDGIQIISPEEAQARREFYDENNIGWVARPKHNPSPENGERPFLRRGKFKKASNMNYAMMVSNRVEDKLVQTQRSSSWTQEDEFAAYEQCLSEVLEEDEDRTWAEGDIRIGDYILIIDSDTRVPEDCLLDAVSEMEQSPQVAILQFTSGVMRVSESFFEGGVEWFTNLIYSAITYCVSIGDSVPFVGHNAVLRWSAVQDAASYQDEDGYEKFWSESHVSEDFDMSLRLQCAGYSCRFASYTGDGFQEGVSLTVYDELARWEKYAYGCNELVFNQLRYWPTRGPITPLFRKFLGSSIHLPKKITICSYIGTYYAIGASWLITLFNYFLTGYFYGLYDKYYLDSFAIFVSVIVVFTGFGNVALAVLRYRLNQKSLLGACKSTSASCCLYIPKANFFLSVVWDNIKWIPVMSIFLGGLSLHVSQAILCHFFSIDMTWGATAKEVEEVNFIEEIPKLIKRFKGTFVFCFGAVGLIIAGIYGFPEEWRITYFASIFPLAWLVACHFLLPVVLNPALMVFAW
ncbi:glycosyl transferase family group 2-domain-containing protein [Xylariaceae sp. AK1471]|nr:glycosyl transferase family group 2-domain-containing protein [Xylariaceae sp. AK1471]